jgi:hypothetical protein
MELVNNNRRGLWNVPYVSSCYLVSGPFLRGLDSDLYTRNDLDPDMAFAANLRDSGAFLYVSNRRDICRFFFSLNQNPDPCGKC